MKKLPVSYIMIGMFEVLLDSLIDTLKLVPILLAVYIIVEIIEQKSSASAAIGKILGGKVAPLWGAGIGLIPQCGFGIIATGFYSKKNIRIGTLIAVYLSTSDEALPILLSTPSAYSKIFPLLLSKFVIAVAFGFLINLIFSKREFLRINSVAMTDGQHKHTQTLFARADGSPACCGRIVPNAEEGEHGNGQNQGKATRFSTSVWKALKHPLRHTATVAVFILAVNIVLSTILFYSGDALSRFMKGAPYIQPLLAALVGLIPNCASSVAITQLYIAETLSLGGAVSGLCCNAGLALVFLFKENKNLKVNLLITVTLFTISVGSGMALTALLKFL